MNINELRPGASNEDDQYIYGISPAQASRIADAIMAEPDTYGMHVDDGGVVKQGPRRNPHLNGENYGEGR